MIQPELRRLSELRFRLIDVLLVGAVSLLLACCLFLVLGLIELRRQNHALKEQMETLIRWHIYVSAKLDEQPVIGQEIRRDAEAPEPDEEATQQR